MTEPKLMDSTNEISWTDLDPDEFNLTLRENTNVSIMVSSRGVTIGRYAIRATKILDLPRETDNTLSIHNSLKAPNKRFAGKFILECSLESTQDYDVQYDLPSVEDSFLSIDSAADSASP